MKIEVKKLNEEIFGIELISESPTELKILKRFQKNGIKINGYSQNSLQLTYRDLMSKDSCIIMLLEEALKEANKLFIERVEKKRT